MVVVAVGLVGQLVVQGVQVVQEEVLLELLILVQLDLQQLIEVVEVEVWLLTDKTLAVVLQV